MKRAFYLKTVLTKIEEAIAPFPKAAMFELHARGFDSLFEQLVSCIISIRTLDEVTIPVSLRLFAAARTPVAVGALPLQQLEQLLQGTTFPRQKAETILGVAKAAAEALGGVLPAHYETLIALKGVGPKCANLALGVAGGYAAISVDVHVHRVVNRWGLVQTKTPEQTLKQLEELIPTDNWIAINRLLMPFGKHICTGRLPHCSTCPILMYCQQKGVTRHQ